MSFPKDFKEFVELLNWKKVKYLLVGGYALAYHSRPKYTEDIDFWIEPTQVNAQKMLSVIDEFGFASLSLTQEDFTNPDMVIQLGMPPLRIDIMTGVSGLDFETAYEHRIEDEYDGLTVSIISLEDLLINKKESGRKKDFADIDWLKTYGKK
jgi:predicted nucleotidyltransferase